MNVVFYLKLKSDSFAEKKVADEEIDAHPVLDTVKLFKIVSLRFIFQFFISWILGILQVSLLRAPSSSPSLQVIIIFYIWGL